MTFLSPLNLGHDISELSGTSNSAANKLTNSRAIPCIIGNSIAGTNYEGELTVNGYNEKSSHEIALANFLAGGVLDYPIVTATSGGTIGNISRFGVYSASGKLLSDILSDLEAKVFLPFATAGIVPDVVIAKSLLENSVAESVANSITPQMIKDQIDKFIQQIRANWPGIPIIFGLCRPSFSINLANDIDCFFQINEYIKTLPFEDVYWYDTTTYSDSTGYLPETIQVSGTLVSSTLTVTSYVGPELKVGDRLLGDSTKYISARTGENTYTLAGTPADQSGTIIFYPYTDFSVHPSARAATKSARQLFPVLKKLFSPKPRLGGVKSVGGLLGSTAISAVTGYSGTRPTQAIPTAVSVASNSCEALSPGLQVTVTNITNGTVFQLVSNWELFNAASVASLTTWRCRIGVRIISGAEHLADIRLQHRHTDNATLETALLWWSTQGSSSINEPTPDFENGDEFLFIPPFPRVGTNITALREYIQIWAKDNRAPTDTIVFQIFEASYETV